MALHCVDCLGPLDGGDFGMLVVGGDSETCICSDCRLQKSGLMEASSVKWDQRRNLAPPPFKGPMKRLLAGLAVGDKRVDALPLAAVCCHGGEARKVGLDPHPDWVDWERVRLGQAVFMKHLGRSYVALSLALLQGFSIARFAEVLYHNGYAQSGETAFERYRETAFAIIDWMTYPLDVENSKAQLQLQNVRAMHSFARRRSRKLFDLANGEGIALSQYDMAEVQLAFAGVTPAILKDQLGVDLSQDETEDLCHAWRTIGFHLGIEDEFNACNSVEDMHSLVEEWMKYVPQRFATCRPATFALQRTALDGFGRYTGVGVEFFGGMLQSTCTTKEWDIDYLERPAHPGMKIFGGMVLPLLGNETVNKLASFGFLKMREAWASNPERQRRMMPWLSAVGRMNDAVLWKLVGNLTVMLRIFFANKMRTFLSGYAIGALLAHQLSKGFVSLYAAIVRTFASKRRLAV